jgi:xylulose-5-phosphate/fructose-6-phosphate phosphoketolase
MKNILFELDNHERCDIRGYEEQGTTTTPFDMKVVNRISRFHLVISACSFLEKSGVLSSQQAEKTRSYCTQKLKEHKAYILKYGSDMEDIESWTYKT